MDILLSGSVAYDYLMTFPGHFHEQILPERLKNISLSFLVDSMTRQRGGIAPNIAIPWPCWRKSRACLPPLAKILATTAPGWNNRAWIRPGQR